MRDRLVDFECDKLFNNIHHQKRELFVTIDHNWPIVDASEVNQSVSIAVEACDLFWGVLRDLSRQLYVFVHKLSTTSFVQMFWIFSMRVDELNRNVVSDHVCYLQHRNSPNAVSTVQYHTVLIIGAVIGD